MPIQDVFQRYEKKYLLSESQYRHIRRRLEDYRMVPDQYGKSTICNIYFDTPDHRLIRRSLEKPVYKEKLRLRSYGVPAADDAVFVELKKKYKGVVYKRRAELSLRDAAAYLYDRRPAPASTQILREIDWFLDFYSSLGPAMAISYDRIALACAEKPGLRVTFDKNILWRDDRLFLDEGIGGNALLEPGQRLMELKIPGAMPLWLADILDEAAAFPTSYSKYGAAYQQMLGWDNDRFRPKGDPKGAMFCA